MKTRLFALLTILLAACIAIGGCSRDPEKVKRRYLENGNKYFAQGKFKEAVIMYKNAIKKDPRFGEAYGKLGDAELRRGEIGGAVRAYRRAIELMPKAEDSAGKLADIYLAAYSVRRGKEKGLLKEVKDLSDTLLAKDPKSYHGLRLKGFLLVSDGKTKESIEAFRQADATRPKQPELRYALLQVLNQDGQWKESEALAREIIKDSPDYVPPYDFLVVEYIRRNQSNDAEAILSKKVENNPKVADFRIQQAGFYRLTHRTDAAEKIVSELLSREKEDPTILGKVADFFVRTRDYKRALGIYSEGADKNPDQRTNYRIRMAQIYVAQGKSQDAIDLIETVLKDDPKSNDALSLRASLLLQYGGKDKAQGAINDLQTLVGRTPRNVVIRYNLARAYQTRGEYDAARVQYQEAVTLAPNFIAGHLGLGQVGLAKRDFGKAISEAEEVLKRDRTNMPARVLKSNALISSGNLRQARLDLTEYLRDTPDAPDLQFQMAIVDFVEGRYKEAESSFRNLRQRYSSDPRLTQAIAEVQVRTNHGAEALKFLQDELQKTPDNKDLRIAVANLALRLDRTDVAEEEYRKLLALDPKNYEIYLRLGETLRRKGQIQTSIEMLKKGQQLAPTNPGANLQLAMTLDAAGMKKESMPLYENVLKVDSENTIALNNLAFMYADEARDLDQALTYAQRAKQKLPNSADVADTLSWIYIKKNLNDNAIAILKELTSKQPKNPTYHYHMGVALLQKGNKPAAKQSLQTALGLKPSKDEEARIRELLSKV